jgi:uncharacterized membrane protein YhaH (DUF805 family)
VTFFIAVGSYWKQALDFRGSTARSEYWFAILFLAAVAGLLFLLDEIFFPDILLSPMDGATFPPLFASFQLLSAIPTVALFIRRQNSLSGVFKSWGWFVWLAFAVFLVIRTFLLLLPPVGSEFLVVKILLLPLVVHVALLPFSLTQAKAGLSDDLEGGSSAEDLDRSKQHGREEEMEPLTEVRGSFYETVLKRYTGWVDESGGLVTSFEGFTTLISLTPFPAEDDWGKDFGFEPVAVLELHGWVGGRFKGELAFFKFLASGDSYGCNIQSFPYEGSSKDYVVATRYSQYLDRGMVDALAASSFLGLYEYFISETSRLSADLNGKFTNLGSVSGKQ